jgi:F0F1-type ATP synthase membrane subunit b/b'
MDRIWANLSPLTEFAIVFITLVGIGFHLRWSRRAAAMGPTLLTTLGIFFCFTGIAWGLLDFDTGDVKASVPHLLQGIRTSFWASVFGIGFALTLKARHMIFGESNAGAAAPPHGATVDDLAEQLLRLNRSVSSDGESGILGQFKLLREGTNSRLEELTASFDKYAEKVAESNSKALIQALQEVIRDFNAKINEQFGENFKQLNASVGKLLSWQVRYEIQLTALIEQETATRKNMADASLRYADLVNKSAVFTTVAQSLSALLAGLETQRGRLETSLGAFAGLVDKAATGLPQIEARIVEMTAQIGRGVESSHDRLTQIFEESARNLQAGGQEMTRLLSTTLAAANTELNEHLRQATEESKRHIMVLDKALEEELRRSIESLGRQLTALSQKFVQDYMPLTVQLQRMLQSTRVS